MTRPARIQHVPHYRPDYPKIDIYEAATPHEQTQGWRNVYAFSTNQWRTCRDALAHARATYPARTFTVARIDRRSR